MESPRPKRIKLEPEDADDADAAQGRHPSWKQCGHLSEEKRLAIKENALAKAQQYAAQLSDVLRQSLKGSDLVQDTAFRKWLENIESTEERNKAFKVLVGVLGATGAGKTSVLNALLGENEILPSGHEGAATAVPCLVAWNHDEEPGHEYKAQIHVMAREDAIEGLTVLVQAFEARRELHDDDDSADLTTTQKQEELRTINEEIKMGMEKIRPVYNLEEDDIEAIVAADDADLSDDGGSPVEQKARKILNTSPSVGNFLETGVRDLYAMSAEELAAEMRSFLDSSAAQHGEDGEEEFAAWPLIKEVHVFLKADVLKSGICLVDLPGAGETVASRAQVARDFQEKLEVTLLVAPIHRAADEDVAQSLLSKHQAAQMELEGSFNERKLGIVLSKVDDLERKNYIKGVPGARDEATVKHFQLLFNQSKEKLRQANGDTKQLAKLQRESKAELTRLKHAHSELRQRDDEERLPVKVEDENEDHKPKRRKKLKATRTTQKMNKYFEAKGKASEIHHQVRMKLRLLDLEKKDLLHNQAIASHGLAYWAVNKRNKSVAERIKKDMKRRQRQFGGSRVAETKDDNGATILPTSSKAFWRLRDEDEGNVVNGFPHKVYSGIPNLERWIHLATLDRRESHLNEILTSYDMAFKGMVNWSTEGEQLNMKLTSEDVEEMLIETHDKYRKEARLVFQKFCERLSSIDPLRDSHKWRKQFTSTIPRMVKKWNRKYPDDENNKEIMAHNTHRAMVVRKGADYVAPKSKIRYEWKAGLSTQLVLGVKECWKLSKQQAVPMILKTFELELRGLWTKYVQSIRDVVDELGHGLGSHFNDFWDTLRGVCDQSIGKAEAALEEVFNTTRKVDNVVQKVLDSGLAKFWKTAASHVGTKSYKRRQEFMHNSMCQKSGSIFNGIWPGVTQLFWKSRMVMHKRFEEISDEAVSEMKLQISFLLKRVLQEENSAADSLKEVRRITMLWKSAWQHGGPAEDHILGQDLKLPESLDSQHVPKTDESDSENEPVKGALKLEDDVEADFEDAMSIEDIKKAIDLLKKVE